MIPYLPFVPTGSDSPSRFADGKEKDSFVQSLIRQGRTFQIHEKGSSMIIFIGGKRINYHSDVTEIKGSGLIGEVHKNIRERLKTGAFKMPSARVPKSHNYSFFQHCRKGALVQVDINNCYWQTLYNIGGIDEETYTKHLLNPEFKLARNASIGSLATQLNIRKYREGKFITSITEKNDLIGINHKVVERVFRAAKDVYKNTDCLMFLSDAFFVKKKDAGKVEKILMKYGYTCKRKNVDIKSAGVDGGGYKIVWHCEGETEDKYYIFNEERQNISNL